jgi:hypothetical protein
MFVTTWLLLPRLTSIHRLAWDNCLDIPHAIMGRMLETIADGTCSVRLYAFSTISRSL